MNNEYNIFDLSNEAFDSIFWRYSNTNNMNKALENGNIIIYNGHDEILEKLFNGVEEDIIIKFKGIEICNIIKLVYDYMDIQDPSDILKNVMYDNIISSLITNIDRELDIDYIPEDNIYIYYK